MPRRRVWWGLWSGLKRGETYSTEPISRVSRPSTDSVGITPIDLYKTLSLAADEVPSIPERRCRHQVVGGSVGAAVTRAAMRYL